MFQEYTRLTRRQHRTLSPVQCLPCAVSRACAHSQQVRSCLCTPPPINDANNATVRKQTHPAKAFGKSANCHFLLYVTHSECLNRAVDDSSSNRYSAAGDISFAICNPHLQCAASLGFLSQELLHANRVVILQYRQKPSLDGQKMTLCSAGHSNRVQVLCVQTL